MHSVFSAFQNSLEKRLLKLQRQLYDDEDEEDSGGWELGMDGGSIVTSNNNTSRHRHQLRDMATSARGIYLTASCSIPAGGMYYPANDALALECRVKYSYK